MKETEPFATPTVWPFRFCRVAGRSVCVCCLSSESPKNLGHTQCSSHTHGKVTERHTAHDTAPDLLHR
jgi:hypothetical protein